MVNNRKIFSIIFFCLLSFALLIFPGCIRFYSGIHGFWISYLAYFYVILLLIRRFPGYKKTVVVSFILTLIGIFIVFFSNNISHNVAIPHFSGFILAIILAYLFDAGKGFVQKTIVLSVLVGVCLCFIFFVLPYWINNMNFGNLTGKISKEMPHDWEHHLDKTDNGITVNTKGKLILLDFFYTGCSICFKKFPLVQKTYNKYKNDSNIVMYAIDIPWERDTPGMALNMIRNRKYTFPVLIGKNKLDSIFGVTVYPTTILVRNDTMLFKGDIEDVQKVMEEELKGR